MLNEVLSGELPEFDLPPLAHLLIHNSTLAETMVE